MPSGYSAILSLNRKSTGDTARSSCARFRTKDISIKNIYSSDLNFYPQKGIEQKAAEIQAVGLLSNLVARASVTRSSPQTEMPSEPLHHLWRLLRIQESSAPSAERAR